MPILAAVSRAARATAAFTLVAAAIGLAPAVAAAHGGREHRVHERDRERLDALLREPDPSPARLYALGNRLLETGDLDAAARAFAESAKRSTQPGNAYYNLACALALRGSTGEALEALRAALDGGYDDPDHMADDEDLDRLHGDPRFDALLREARALEMPPVNPGRWQGWWGAGRDHGRRESREAAARLEAYLAAHPRSGRAAYGVGIARLNLDDFEASARAFLRALELGYRPEATLYNLACVEARRGRVEDAFRHLDRAIEAGFHEPWQIRADEDLDALRGDPRYGAALRRASDLSHADGRHAGDRGWNWRWGWDDGHDGDDEGR